ncbi:hypothetical protein evm_013769 [Chilo suppressalis]|nr:hypothetical protein evm_013769 [Chilo suppressalis]
MTATGSVDRDAVRERRCGVDGAGVRVQREILKEMAPRKKYSHEQLEKAVEAVKNGEKIAVAAKRFGVPRITLHDKIWGKTTMGCTMGPSTVLTKGEEDILEKCILALYERHIPLTKDSLLDSVQKIIIDQNRPQRDSEKDRNREIN